MLAAWNRLQAEAAAKAEAAAEAAAKAKTAHNKWSKKIMKEFEEEDEKKREVVIKWLVEIGYGHPEEMLDEVITNLLRNVENYSEINETKLDEILKGVHTLEDIDKIKERRPPVSE